MNYFCFNFGKFNTWINSVLILAALIQEPKFYTRENEPSENLQIAVLQEPKFYTSENEPSEKLQIAV